MTKEVLKLALEALETCGDDEWHTDDDFGMMQTYDADKVNRAIIAIKEALAQPAQEPVAWMNNKDFEPIRVRIMQEAYELADRNDSESYNAIKVMCGDVQRMLPPKRPWVGLTEKEIDNFFKAVWGPKVTFTDFIRAIEQALKEKNT